MPTKRFELDGEPEAVARAIALEGKERRSRRWRRRTAPAPRTWWLSSGTAGTAGAVGAAAPVATLPAP